MPFYTWKVLKNMIIHSLTAILFILDGVLYRKVVSELKVNFESEMKC